MNVMMWLFQELVATLAHASGAIVETTGGGAVQSVVTLAFKIEPESLAAGEYTVICSLRNATSGVVRQWACHV